MKEIGGRMWCWRQDVMLHTCNLSTWVAEVGGLPDGLNYIERPYL
jgi:hypothetical protein